MVTDWESNKSTSSHNLQSDLGDVQDLGRFDLSRSRSLEAALNNPVSSVPETGPKMPERYKDCAQQLKDEREQKGWKLEELAEMISASVPEVISWEDGNSIPDDIFRGKLSEIYGKKSLSSLLCKWSIAKLESYLHQV